MEWRIVTGKRVGDGHTPLGSGYAWHVRRASPWRGFTLVELLIVLAIVALLLTIVTPRYFSSLERAKEVTLKEDLKIIRTSLDRFYGDRGRYPNTLDELVSERYLREIPVDPLTESAATWIVVPPETSEDGGVADVKSGAAGAASDGGAYIEW
jgi:general secretion pathway protein G